MNKLGYQVNWTDTRKYITYTTPEGYKCRDNKLYEEKYTKGVMENEFKRIKEEQSNSTRQSSNSIICILYPFSNETEFTTKWLCKCFLSICIATNTWYPLNFFANLIPVLWTWSADKLSFGSIGGIYNGIYVKNFITKYSSISARVLCYASFFIFSIILLFSSITPS